MRLDSRIDFGSAVARDLARYRRARQLRWLKRLLLICALFLAFTLGVAVGAAHGAALYEKSDTAQQPPKFSIEVEKELPCLDLRVWPKVMLPLTRADLRIELGVRRHANHRVLAIAWDGGFAGGGGSQQQLRGDKEPYLIVRTVKNQPAAPWIVVAAVFDEKGKVTGQDSASIVMPEAER